jgi:hypothetical protein
MLIMLAQASRPNFSRDEVIAGAIRWSTGLVVAYLAYRFARRVPWPRPFRLRFAAVHLVAAPFAAFTWFAASSAIEATVPGFVADVGPRGRLFESLFIGIVLYAIIVGISYAFEGSSRAARAEAIAAQAQLAALRAQLHPHFLIIALHTVVHLIPSEPARASEAAELVADLLRTTMEEQRDEVTLGDEWKFVSRYLAVERIRFEDRLIVRADIPDNVLGERVPSFALQTLVENAVHHGAAPRAAATEILVSASATESELTLAVRNSGDHRATAVTTAGAGTGLARLRDRLSVLHGNAARVTSRRVDDGGFESVIVLPRQKRVMA